MSQQQLIPFAFQTHTIRVVEQAPRDKAHPQCMCSLTPVTRPNKTPGAKDAGEFLRRLPEDKRQALMPKWARDMQALRLPGSFFTDEKTGWFRRKKDALAAVGEERFAALRALGQALARQDWPQQKIGIRGNMWKRTAAALEQQRHEPEVAEFLDAVASSGGQGIDSRWHHYIKRRYLNGWRLETPDDLDAVFEQVLANQQAQVFVAASGKTTRYLIYENDRLAIFDRQGARISVSPITLDRLQKKYGLSSWIMRDMLKI